MARIQQYKTDTTITGGDKLVGNDAADNSTKLFQISDIAAFFAKEGIADGAKIGYQFNYGGKYANSAIDPGNIEYDVNPTAPSQFSWANIDKIAVSTESANSADISNVLPFMVNQNIKVTDILNNTVDNFAVFNVTNITDIQGGKLLSITMKASSGNPTAPNIVLAPFGFISAADLNALTPDDIVDNLISTDNTKVLSAAQGKILKDLVDLINAAIASNDPSLDTLQEVVDYIKANNASIASLNTTIATKEDKVAGKGLSTEDFTSNLLAKLNSIATGAEVNVQSNWSQSNSASDAFIQNKPTDLTDLSIHSVTELSDVNITGVANNEVLKYNGSTGNWENQTDDTIGGSGSGVANKIAIWSGASALTQDTNLHWDTTNDRLGIGTSSPNAALEVHNTLNIGDGTSVTSIGLQRNSANYITATDAAGYLVFRTGGANERLRIDSSGNVGIGTAAPKGDLHVAGAAGSAGRIYLSDSDNGVESTDSLLIMKSGSNAFVYNRDGGQMSFGTNNVTNTLNIANTGNVGIGTSSPSTKLQVKTDTNGDGIQIQHNSTTAGTYGQLGFLSSTNDSGAANVWIRGYRGSSFTDNFMTFGTGGNTGSEAMRIDSSGNVGIGTTSPANGKLQIDSNGTSNQISIETGTSGDGRLHIGHFSNGAFIGTYGDDGGVGDVIRFGTHSGDERMRIDSSGNVGIGTTSPGQKLHVTGNARVTGAYYDSNNLPGTSGQVLSSTATGTDWVSLSEISGVDGAGTANTVAMWSDSDTITDAPITVSGNNATFAGDVLVEDNLYLTDAGTVRGKIQLNSSDRDDLDIKAVSLGSNMKFFTVDTERMRIDSAGNVGIGTTTPATNLEIKSTGNTIVRLSTDGDAADQQILQFYRNSGAYAQIDYDPGGGNSSGLSLTDFRDDINSHILFNTRGTNERMRIESDGNVGIGTTSPSYKLDVDDSQANSTIARFRDNSGATQQTLSISSIATGMQIRSAYSTGISNQLDIQTAGGNSFLTLSTNSAERLRINSSGNVGIGVTSPLVKTQISTNLSSGSVQDALLLSQNTATSSSGQGVKMYLSSFNSITRAAAIEAIAGSSNDHSLGFYTNSAFAPPAERLRIDSSGNVGIGTTSPSEKFEVTGNTILDASNANLKIKAGTTGTKGDIQWTFNSDSTVYASVGIEYDNRATDGFLIDSGYPITIDTAGAYTRFSRNGAEHMRINSSGNVGIGTTSPAFKLDISGSLRASSVTLFGGEIINTVGHLVINQNAVGSEFFYRNNSAEQMRITSAGQVKFNNYTSSSAFTGTAAANLAVDSSGNIITEAAGGGGGGGTSTIQRNTFSGNGSTTQFTLTSAIADEINTQVYIDGVYQSKLNYSTSGTTLTFSTAPSAGSNNIEVVHIASVSINNASTLSKNTFTGDGSTTAFGLSITPTSEDFTFVFIQGVYQEKSTYSITSSTLNFSTAPTSGYSIEVMNIGAVNIQQTNYLANDTFTGNGTLTSFTLVNGAPTHENFTMVFLDGVYQAKAGYSLSGGAIVFSAAPGNNTVIEIISISGAGVKTLPPTGINDVKYQVSVINSDTTATAGRVYVLTAALTLTLPALPNIGNSIKISNRSGVATCVLGANGNNIMGSSANLTLDTASASFELIYSGANQGWVIIGQ